MLSIGQLLQERYQIIAKLGEGGMGAVYRAHDNRLNVECVVKEMLITPEALANAAAAADQFKREAGVLAMLRHPNLPRVGDYFIDQGSYYLVMDYIEGIDLRKLISANGLPEATVLHYTVQLLDVLEYIHGEGVVHRDIKPANIIVQTNGRVVLVDFGLAKMQSAGVSMTRTFVRGAGTPEYAPPEQMKGGTDQRSDIYSLGATMYQALTGRAPLDATDRATGIAMLGIRKVIPGVSARTERVVQKAMMMNRDLRYPTAAAMRAELGDVAKAITQPPARKTPVKVAQPLAAAAPLEGTAIIGAPQDQKRRRTIQIGAAISIVALILVAAIALPSMLSSNSSAGVSTATKALSTSTTLPLESAATSDAARTTVTLTQPPQDTATPQPTSVRVIATTTLYPSATTVPTETPTPTSTTAPPTKTPRPSATPAPNASPVAPGMLYPAPVLVSPASETVFAAQDTPRLSWSSAKAMGADDYFYVEIGHAKGSDPYYVKDTSVTPRDYLPGLSVNGRLTWRVSVVRKSGESYTVVSPVSATWVFVWQPAQQGPGPGPGATPTLAPP